jgi:hypothetical protein
MLQPYLDGKSVLYFMSTRDLVIEETQRQIDYVIQAIPEDKKNFSKDFSKEQLQYKELADFLLGYELGYVVGKSLEYHNSLHEELITWEEQDQIQKDIQTIIARSLPQIKQTIQKAIT